MFKFCNLCSGSSGNCSLVCTNNVNILIDCGTTQKKILNSLEELGKNIQQIDGIIVTHEHTDHIKSLGSLSKKYNIPIYANKKTFDNMTEQTNLISETNKKIFNTNDYFEIGDLKIHPFLIPHDAAEPCGFNIFNTNKKISIATDIGHMTNEILHKLEGSAFLLLESNYEPEILKYAKYPYYLKRRIAGPNGHLSNQEAGSTIIKLISSGVNNFLLGHLSQQTNFPELAYKTVMDEIIENKVVNNFILNVANRDKPNNIVNIA